MLTPLYSFDRVCDVRLSDTLSSISLDQFDMNLNLPRFGSGTSVAFVRSDESIIMLEESYSWIKSHKVCFEIAPFNCLHKSKINQVGFELHLYAQPSGWSMKDPASPDAHNLYFGLQRIAYGAIPSIVSGCRCEVSKCESSFRLRPETGLMEEVHLVLMVVHRENYLEAVDKSEAACVEEIKQRLIRMGVQQNVWQENVQRN